MGFAEDCVSRCQVSGFRVGVYFLSGKRPRADVAAARYQPAPFGGASTASPVASADARAEQRPTATAVALHPQTNPRHPTSTSTSFSDRPARLVPSWLRFENQTQTKFFFFLCVCVCFLVFVSVIASLWCWWWPKLGRRLLFALLRSLLPLLCGVSFSFRGG